MAQLSLTPQAKLGKESSSKLGEILEPLEVATRFNEVAQFLHAAHKAVPTVSTIVIREEKDFELNLYINIILDNGEKVEVGVIVEEDDNLDFFVSYITFEMDSQEEDIIAPEKDGKIDIDSAIIEVLIQSAVNHKE